MGKKQLVNRYFSSLFSPVRHANHTAIRSTVCAIRRRQLTV